MTLPLTVLRMTRLPPPFTTAVPRMIFLGLPWGVGVGPLFHLPLPTKVTARFLPALEVEGDSAEDEDRVDRLYAEVTETMQSALNEMAQKRRWPILG